MSDSGSPALVVLVPGVLVPSASLLPLGWRLRRCGFRVVRFAYPSTRRSVADNARLLGAFAARQHASTLHFVAHSLGGIIVQRMFADPPALPPGRVVALGTPFRASAVARRLAASRAGRLLLGRSLEHGLLEECTWSGDRELGVIAGRRPVGVGRVLADLPAPSDGTVSVAETQVNGAKEHLVLPVSHTGMALSAEVVRQTCCFLRDGQFARGSDHPVDTTG